jgi:hypothetical protein
MFSDHSWPAVSKPTDKEGLLFIWSAASGLRPKYFVRYSSNYNTGLSYVIRILFICIYEYVDTPKLYQALHNWQIPLY